MILRTVVPMGRVRGEPVKGHPGIFKRMTKGSASRPPEVRYDVSVRGPDGVERTKTFRTRDDAVRWRREMLAARDRGGWVDPRAARTTLRDWAEQWERTTVDLRPSTKRIYSTNLRLHILPKLGPVPLGSLEPVILREWMAELAGGALSAGTVNQVYRTLRRVIGSAMENGLLARNPLAGVKPPRAEHEEMKFLNATELGALAEEVGPAYRALVLVAGYCGLRSSELVGLRRHRVDLMRRRIEVVEQVTPKEGGGFVVAPPKTRAGRRTVPIPRHVAEALAVHIAEWAEQTADGLVFPSIEGGPLEVHNFRNRVWTPATKRAGLDGLRLHDLRHTCASLSIAAGADVKVLQRMMGHSSAAMTLDRYGHLMPDKLDDLADRLDEIAAEARPASVVRITRDAAG